MLNSGSIVAPALKFFFTPVNHPLPRMVQHNAYCPREERRPYQSPANLCGCRCRCLFFFCLTAIDTLKPPQASDSSEPGPPPRPRENNMKKASQPDPLAPRPSLDFSKGVRGKHFARMQHGTNIVLIAPDLLDNFPDSEAINEALRSLKKIANRSAKLAQRPRKTASAR
jgi:hypothetical protein